MSLNWVRKPEHRQLDVGRPRPDGGFEPSTFLLWGNSANHLYSSDKSEVIIFGPKTLEIWHLGICFTYQTRRLHHFFLYAVWSNHWTAACLLCVSVSLLKTEFLLFIKVQLIFQIIWCIITGEANYSSSTHCWKNVTQYNYILGKGQLSVTKPEVSNKRPRDQNQPV